MAELLASDLLEDDASDLASEHLARGTRLGRFELLVPIAKGGMARVWAARQHGQRGFTKLVAVKTILPHLARDQEFERMFLDEARIASLVQHPNVCTIYELGEEGTVLYLAMEWVHGSSLAHLLRPPTTSSGASSPKKVEPLDPRVVARIVTGACAGLHAAHNLTNDDGQPMGVVHRDVSPHNILVSADGNVKVADFGVAKALGQMHSTTSAGQLKGKLNYMAPEQVSGLAVDRRADLFSLGCVLYEATTGLKPFKAEGDHQVMHRLLKGEFEPPSKVIKGYPEELEKIITRAMAPQPLRRFHTAEQLRNALEEWLAKSGTIVTEAQIAGVMKSRLGTVLDERRDAIRAASANPSDRPEQNSEPPPPVDALTPSERGRSNSGVKASAGMAAARPSSIPPPLPAKRGSLPSIPMISASGGVIGPRSSPPFPIDAGSAPTIVNDVDDLPLPVLVLSGEDGPEQRPPYPAAPLLAPASPTHYVMAAILGVIAAAAMTAICFLAWRPPPPILVAGTGTPTGEVMPMAAPAPEKQAHAAESDLFFNLVPDSALLVVNGVELPPSVRKIARPKEGQTIDVVVRAPNHGEEKRTVDATTPSPFEVVLTPRPSPSAVGQGAPAASASGSVIAPVQPRPFAAPRAEAIPANPY